MNSSVRSNALRLIPTGAPRAGTWVALVVAAACGGSDTTMPPAAETPGGGTAPTSVTVTFAVAVDQDRAAISPFIYGSNQDAGASLWTVRRSGGNRSTGYNWETNFSNAGSDYLHNSDLFSISNARLPASDAAIPARALLHTHDQSLAMGAQTILTLPMAGYVAADGNGPVAPSEAAPSSRWLPALPKKPSPFAASPDLSDGAVYMDELVHLLVQRYGVGSSARGVRWYSLDNEPALWANTHPRIHPQKVGAAELLERSIALATAVKAADPTAEILGPAEYGMSGFVSLQSAPDWFDAKGSYDWYLDYMLDGMKKAEQAGGKRLLDLLDVHWYSEARGDHRVTDRNATTAADAAARLQAPRSLWDATYRENSWIQQVLPGYLPIIPRLRQSIAQYYPGTRLAITEYGFGGEEVVSGGIAQADVLGVFGRSGVHIATIWGLDSTDLYALAAFRLFRDFDGLGGTFGGTSVRAVSGDLARASVYASIHGAADSVLHLVVLNKDARDTLAAKVQLSGASYTGAEVWGFGPESARITRRAPVAQISANMLEYPIPPLSALHFVVRR